jgi:hypothetical protein
VPEVFSSVQGVRLADVVLSVPQKGVWFADCDTEGPDPIEPREDGRVVLALGQLELIGTLIDGGESNLGRKVRIVGGGGGWGRELPPLAYANDAGVKARAIAQDACGGAGEVLGDFAPTAATLGPSYARSRGPASTTLEISAGGALWWVDYAGLTQVGTRAAHTPDPAKVRVLEYHQRDQTVTLSVDDPTDVVIGSVLSGGVLPGELTVRGLTIKASSGKLDVTAWVGGSETSATALVDLFKGIVQRIVDNTLSGLYKYRVTTVTGNRVNLQVVNARNGLPSALSRVRMWGAGGIHTVCSPGCEVLVAFVDTDRAQPVVVGFAGGDDPGFAPASVCVGGTADDSVALAKVGSTVSVYLPAAMPISGLLAGVPFTGVISPVQAATGLINDGCTIAKGK